MHKPMTWSDYAVVHLGVFILVVTTWAVAYSHTPWWAAAISTLIGLGGVLIGIYPSRR